MSKNIQELQFEANIDPKLVMKKEIFLLNNPDRTFEKWGELLFPILTRTHRNTIGIAAGNRYWEEDGTFKKFLTRNQAFYPPREINYQLTTLFEGQLKDAGMHIVHEYDSHGGFSHYWQCLSDRFDTKIRDSFEVDDVVQVGMVVRNGIETDVALGIDFFTYRLSCKNGAISNSSSAGNISISHANDYAKMKDRFLEAIPIAIDAAKKLIKYYQRAVYVRMNQKIAEDMYLRVRKSISEKYFPDNFNIDKDLEKEDPTKISKIVNYKDDHESLYESFNKFTRKLWHSDRLQFTGIRNGETAVHRALLANIPEAK